MVSYEKYLDFEIFEGEISKHQYPWHFHNSYTIILVESGSVMYEFRDGSLTVNAAEAFIIEPFRVHRNTISQLTAYKAIFVPIEYFESLDQNKIATLKVSDRNVVDSIENLFNAIELDYSKRQLKEIILVTCKLINQAQIVQIGSSPISINLTPKINYNLRIKQLAEAANLSKFHFQRKFKKNFGLTIGQLKQQEKTITAKILLQKGRLSPDAAYQLGFFDQSHFIKYFKKMWAITPKNFK